MFIYRKGGEGSWVWWGGIWKDVDIVDVNLRGANVRLMSNIF